MSSVHVFAPSRLHFGLLAFGNTARRQYGGCGVMLQTPRTALTIKALSRDSPSRQTDDSESRTTEVPDNEFKVVGDATGRAADFSRLWSHNTSVGLDCELQVDSTIPSHAGFGSGTQMALAVAAGLNEFFGVPCDSAAQLATSVGRGGRSAVGTYGFLHGGFIAEQGKLPGEPLGVLAHQMSLPPDWRVVLVRSPVKQGLSGEAESRAFGSELPAIPDRATVQMERLLWQQMVPALQAADCEGFGTAVYEYGLLAGNCFARLQGGPFSCQQAALVVDKFRELGVTGVGQSSWGPTLFGIVPAQEAAERVAAALDDYVNKGQWRVDITEFDNQGAAVKNLEREL